MSEHRNSADDLAIDAEMLEVLLMTMGIGGTATRPVFESHGTHPRRRRPFHQVQLAQGWQELVPGIEFKRLCVDEQAGTKYLFAARGPA